MHGHVDLILVTCSYALPMNATARSLELYIAKLLQFVTMNGPAQ